MYRNLREFIESLWKKGVGEPFSEKALLAQLRSDGGEDAAGLTEALVRDLLDGKEDADWDEAVFACSELLCFYRALEGKWNFRQITGAVFSLCVLTDSLRTDEFLTLILMVCGKLGEYVEGEWDKLLENENLTAEDLRMNGPKLDEDDLLYLCYYLFSKGVKNVPPPPPPSSSCNCGHDHDCE